MYPIIHVEHHIELGNKELTRSKSQSSPNLSPSNKTSEIVKEDGSVEKRFDLKYESQESEVVKSGWKLES